MIHFYLYCPALSFETTPTSVLRYFSLQLNVLVFLVLRNNRIMLIMQIMQTAQYLQGCIRQFLNTGDPYYTFPAKNVGVLKISWVHVWETRLLSCCFSRNPHPLVFLPPTISPSQCLVASHQLPNIVLREWILCCWRTYEVMWCAVFNDVLYSIVLYISSRSGQWEVMKHIRATKYLLAKITNL